MDALGYEERKVNALETGINFPRGVFRI